MTAQPTPVLGSSRHFRHLPPATLDRLFLHPPGPFSDRDPRERVAHALGATLYVPATRPDLAEVIARRHAEGVTSMVIDLEDSVSDDEVDSACDRAVRALQTLADTEAASMLLFLRPRDPAGIARIARDLGSGVEALTGIVVPKFSAETGNAVLDAVAQASETVGKRLYAMPVLETARLVYRESRDAEMAAVAAALARHRDRVLAVRIGATDMSSLFGIRRDRDLTIYDVRVVTDVIAAIVNHLGRRDGTGFVVTGPVWEYFADHERMFRPLLRATPFERHDAGPFRARLVGRDLDGLLRETALDRANGIHGKTVIHPSHVAPVHALSAVTHEEYQDATDIAAGSSGLTTSTYRNKMNEVKPHRSWAEQVLVRASVFGVTRPEISFVDLLTELVEADR